jgi:hypothetical protein
MTGIGEVRLEFQCEGYLLVGGSVVISSRNKFRYLPLYQLQESGVVRELAKAGRSGAAIGNRGGSVVDDGPLGGPVLSKAEFPFWP